MSVTSGCVKTCHLNCDAMNQTVVLSTAAGYFGELQDLPWSISSVQFSHSVVSDSSQSHESQHARPPCSSPTPGVHSDSRPSSQLCHQYPLIPSGLDGKLDGKWHKFIPLYWANMSTCKGCKAGSLEQSPWKGRNSDTLRAGWEVDHSCFYNCIQLHHHKFITLLKPIRALRL